MYTSFFLPVWQAQMRWSTWAWYVTTSAVTKVIAACDYAGEALASFFGITTPKYQYEYDEYQRMLEEVKILGTREPCT
jgi:hypothetical protein